MELRRVYQESMPRVKLVGKRFTNQDRDEMGTFGKYWRQSEEWFARLAQCRGIPGVSEDRVGAMRMADGGFEYWIGAFLDPAAQVPEGFEAVEIPAGEVGVCWLCGSESTGELYGMEASQMAMGAMAGQGWRVSETGWMLERYNCPRFTQPDEQGRVILDIGAYLV